MPATDENDAHYRVAYDEAVRALAEQQALIESLRARAGLLLSAAAIATSFLGSQALAGGSATVLVWLSLACFFGSTATALAILWPREWALDVNPEMVIGTYAEGEKPSSPGELHRDLSLYMRQGWEHNRRATDLCSMLCRSEAPSWPRRSSSGLPRSRSSSSMWPMRRQKTAEEPPVFAKLDPERPRLQPRRGPSPMVSPTSGMRDSLREIFGRKPKP